MATGASVQLSYFPSFSATCQVQYAIKGIRSSVMAGLKLIAISVEPTDGEVFFGPSQNVVSAPQRVQYITDAVSYVRANYPSLKVIIQASSGPKHQSWSTITGGRGLTGFNACPALVSLPLWNVETKVFTDGSGRQFCGDGVAGLTPWTPWDPNTWSARSGNKYYFGEYSSQAAISGDDQMACGAESFFGLNDVNLDYFDPVQFQ